MGFIERFISRLKIKKGVVRSTVWLSAICTVAAVTLVVTSSSAHPGHEPYASPFFTPTLEVQSDNISAGAHPNLKIRMKKAHPNDCGTGIAWVGLYCYGAEGTDMYIEQDLKKWRMIFPPGLMADIQAVPERCYDPQMDPEFFRYSCPPGSKIGEIQNLPGKRIKHRNCAGKGSNPSFLEGRCSERTDTYYLSADTYMGVPLGSEQARLHTLIKLENQTEAVIRVDTVVTAKQGPSGLEIEAVTDNLPDTYCLYRLPDGICMGTEVPAQMYEVSMTLFGATGAERGHPLLTNSTSCSQRVFGSTFTGYAGYSQDDHPGEGTGNTISDTTPFPVNGCNRLDYSPDLSINLAPNTPGAVPALTTTLSQDQGEQTTKEVKVRFPRGLGVNLANKVSPCSQDNFSTDTCPDSSRIGSVVAKSRLVPEGQLSGSIYLGQASDGSFPLLLSLKGFVDLALQGKVAVSSDGTLEATFSNLPEVPIDSFTLSLDGSSERGMLKVPASCRHSSVETLFTSHQGKEHNVTTPLNIGCNQGTLAVDVDPQKTGAHPTVTLEAQASGISDVSFRLPANLKVKSSGLVTSGRSYGTLGLDTLNGRYNNTLKPVSSSDRAKSTTFAAISSGSIKSMATTAPGRVIQSCKSSRRKAKGKKKARGARKRKRGCKRTASGGTVISFTDLPDDLTSVTVELEGEKSHLLTNPSKCSKNKRSKKTQKPKLDFSATIIDVKGTTYTPSKSVTLKCAKKKRSRRSTGKQSVKRG